MIKTYALLTKPGILMGNAVTTLSGFFLASKGDIHLALLLATLVGLGCVIASACIWNNWIDRRADALMERTKKRALATGAIPSINALLLACTLGILGFVVLSLFTTALGVLLAGIGFFIYVVVYSLLKYHSLFGTLVGSIAGAIPPVVGYSIAAERFDLGAFLLFAILVLWQMPHFYAIALYRYEDYTKASIPVLPIARGIHSTKVQMIAYISAFLVASLALHAAGYTGSIYLATALVLGISWLILALYGFISQNHQRWGKQMFAFSLVVVMLLCFSIAVDFTQ